MSANRWRVHQRESRQTSPTSKKVKVRLCLRISPTMYSALEVARTSSTAVCAAVPGAVGTNSCPSGGFDSPPVPFTSGGALRSTLCVKLQLLLQPLQIDQQVLRRLVTFVTVFSQSLHHEPLQLGRRFRCETRQRRRVSFKQRQQSDRSWSLRQTVLDRQPSRRSQRPN